MERASDRAGLIERAVAEMRRRSAEGAPPHWSFAQWAWLWCRLNGLSLPELHARIAHWLERRGESGDARLLLQVFRDAGKSTLLGLYCAWRLSRNPDLRILIVAAEHELASKMAKNVADILDAHPLARATDKAGRGARARDRFSVRRQAILRDPSVLAKGLYANATGARADLIVLDDVEVPNTAGTAAKRARLRRRIEDFGFILAKGGDIVAIGTPHAFDTIYAERPKPGGGDAPFAGFDRLTIPVIEPNGRLAWPERYDAAAIERVRRDAGETAFRSQMLLVPVDPKEPRLSPDRLIAYEGAPILDTVAASGLWLEGNRIRATIAFWDPSFGARDRGDGSVIAVMHLCENGAFWLQELAYLTHEPNRAQEIDEASQLCAQAADLLARAHAKRVVVENNGLGKFLPGLLRKELRARRLAIAVAERTTVKRKSSRILAALEPVLAASALRAHRSVFATPFVEEMRAWSPEGGGRDDGLDAVAACIEEAPPLGAAGRIARSPRGGAFQAGDFTP